MAAGRRKSLRKSAQSTENNRAQSEASSSTAAPGQPEGPEIVQSQSQPSGHSEENRCPACLEASVKEEVLGKESWVRCDACKKWFHWRCAGEGDDLETVDKWSALLRLLTLMNLLTVEIALKVLSSL